MDAKPEIDGRLLARITHDSSSRNDIVARTSAKSGTREACEKSGMGRKFHLRESRLSRTFSLFRLQFTRSAHE